LNTQKLSKTRQTKEFQRGLKKEYLDQLKTRGKLSFLRNTSLLGPDIDIQIRDNYINLYYKGSSLLMFKWKSTVAYTVNISEAYFKPEPPIIMANIPVNHTGNNKKMRSYNFDERSIKIIGKNFKEIVNKLKSNIRYLGKGKENAFEQVFIENNIRISKKDEIPKFIILDRQVVAKGLDRLDLIAISKLPNTSNYRLNLVELKYGKDRRIPDVHDNQLKKYYDIFLNDYGHIVDVYKKIIVQKKAIGRWPYGAIEKFKISENPETIRKIAIFGNIDKDSELLRLAKKQFDNKTSFAVINNIINEDVLKQK
jgi:hypothetical protein